MAMQKCSDLRIEQYRIMSLDEIGVGKAAIPFDHARALRCNTNVPTDVMQSWKQTGEIAGKGLRLVPHRYRDIYNHGARVRVTFMHMLFVRTRV